MYIYIYICMYVCMYVYIYLYMNTLVIPGMPCWLGHIGSNIPLDYNWNIVRFPSGVHVKPGEVH